MQATAHSLEDLQLQRLAAKLHLPVNEAVVEMDFVKQLYGVNLETCQKYMKIFAAMDKTGDGRVQMLVMLCVMCATDVVALSHGGSPMRALVAGYRCL